MQSLDQPDGGVTITRSASQQMMHFSLTANQQPLYGIVFNDNTTTLIDRVGAPQAPEELPESAGCGFWISHAGLGETALHAICQPIRRAHATLLLLLDSANKGRMDLRAAMLDADGAQLHPLPIVMIEG